jgi:nuclear protein localization family protein 4
MTIADMVLRQTRIERQEKPRCASLSFDGQAANVFQACAHSLVRMLACMHAHALLTWHLHALFARSYVSAALSFSIQRAGLLYGTCSEDGAVAAHFIYEPPQQARPSAERGGGARRRVAVVMIC